MASRFSTLGVCNLATPFYLRTGKATDFKFGGHVYRANSNKSPLKILRKWSVGVSRDCPNFLVPPIISGTGKATDYKFGGYIYRVNLNESLFKNFGEKGARAYPGTVQILGVPPII